VSSIKAGDSDRRAMRAKPRAGRERQWRTTDPALTAAQATLRTAGDRLSPVEIRPEELLRVLQFPGQGIGPHDFGVQARQCPDFYTNYKDGQFSHLIHPQLSPTWVVPTRHPEALNTALQTAPGDWDFANGR
jgi:hypothetical protein